MSYISAHELSVAYDKNVIVKEMNVEIPEGKITSIIGPNGCGKSTLLKAISRIKKPHNGIAYLQGEDIHKMKTKDVAKKLAILSQAPELPGGLTVEQLVSYGRYPHQNGLQRFTKKDREAVNEALKNTNLIEFRDRPVDALSGGQRQRAWIAMALAQETELLFLDEPTTYLDMAHQMEVLELLERLNREEGRTIVMVIHDINHAARFSDHLIALKDGQLLFNGDPYHIICPPVLKEIFHIDAYIGRDPRTDKPVCITYNLLQEEEAPPLKNAAGDLLGV
ncbi:ABC transporter ATP-binding protein [Salipaludibacillus sp. HK11]|uniref:ABC transporter ATP-binding protein n=1 Tax=Salipaludibacillus sp. HK11 TaxID=3394320 RepID=UPI0039FC37A4